MDELTLCIVCDGYIDPSTYKGWQEGRCTNCAEAIANKLCHAEMTQIVLDPRFGMSRVLRTLTMIAEGQARESEARYNAGAKECQLERAGRLWRLAGTLQEASEESEGV